MNAAEPELVATPDQPDPPKMLGWKDYANLLGFVRIIVGQVRDSSGRPNNMLGLLYAYTIFFVFAIYWVSHPSVTATLVLSCPNKISKKISVTSAATQQATCGVTQISITPKLPTPPAYPASFYFALIIPLCSLLVVYLARHPVMRQWLLSLVQAYRGQNTSSGLPFAGIIPPDWKFLPWETSSPIVKPDKSALPPREH